MAKSTAVTAVKNGPWDEDKDYSEMNVVSFYGSMDADQISSYEAAIAALEQAGIETEEANADTIGDGFAKVGKEALINKSCVFITWQFSKPENERYDNPYVIVRGVTREGERFWFADGSTGVCAELARLTERRIKRGSATPNAGLLVKNGLSKSEYTFTDDKGSEGTAVTYHIAI